jgi:hypothetical protein
MKPEQVRYLQDFAGRVFLSESLLEVPLLDFTPPNPRPDGSCRWVPSEDGEWIEYDGSVGGIVHFDNWLWYLIKHFLEPWDYYLNGEVYWQGVEEDDYGVLVVIENLMDAIWQDEEIIMPESLLRALYGL